MANYFACAHTKPAAISGGDPISLEDSRPDLLKPQYDLTRKDAITYETVDQIGVLFKRWCESLKSGLNIVVIGPKSRYDLLETFKTKCLDSGTFLGSTPGGSLKHLNIVTVRLHGLDPIKMETFNHAIFSIKETRKVKESDYHNFIQIIEETQRHYVFLIHACEYFIDNCEEVFETIARLNLMIPKYVHIILGSDHWNGGLRLKNLQHGLNLADRRTYLPGIDSYLWEKTKLMGDFDYAESKANETIMHRLFSDKTDLQSLKDIYQALDSATQQILTYIIKDLIDKIESNTNNAEALSKKRFQGIDAEDDEEHELKAEEKADDIAPMRTRRANNNNTGARKKPSTRQSRAPRSISTHLDFQHLLKYCESKFIVRRGTALRDHLGELKDHKLVSFEDAGNKIQCLVEVEIGKKFLAWVSES